MWKMNIKGRGVKRNEGVGGGGEEVNDTRKRGLKHANEDHDDCEMAQCAGGERREG